MASFDDRSLTDLLRSADYLVVGAGAGFSADCGLRTYEDLVRSGVEYRNVASPDCLAKEPAQFFSWTSACTADYSRAVPHAGYEALARLFAQRDAERKRSFVLTTNVDGMFARAGLRTGGEVNVCETHGSYLRWQCSGLARDASVPSYQRFQKPCTSAVWPSPPEQRTADGYPACPGCGRPARPNVYLFGDTNYLASAEQETAWFDFQQEMLAARAAPPSVVLLEVGVGARLPKISVTFQRIAQRLPATLVRVNTDPPSAAVAAVHSVQMSARDFLVRYC